MSATEPLFIALTQKLVAHAECATATLKDPTEAQAVADHFLQLIPDIADIRQQCGMPVDPDAPRFIKLDASGQPLTDDAGHVITRDASTGLEWAAASDKRLTHAKAMKACESLKLAGGGWRAPTRQELLSIVDLARYSPAVDTDAFPFVKADWYWSSDAAAWSSASAWDVSFDFGGVGYYRRGSFGFALAVRRAGQ